LFASRRIVILSSLVALLSTMIAGAASAEPKNQWPFTRPATSRVLTQAATNGLVDSAPMPEPKNEWPFTRIVGTRATSSAGAATVSNGGSGGIDWPLAGWASLVAVTLVGGGFALRRAALFRPRNHPA
jgi:hypothetical protein